MSERLITLTTDFGEQSHYVAAMKGVILGINPKANIVDLSHHIPPQDVRHAAWFLAKTIPWFPADTIHLIVVDPGVGTARQLLLVHSGTQWLIAPDNGCWTTAAAKLSPEPQVWRLAERTYWRSEVSHTFHGRDILSPVAAHLSAGIPPESFGPAITEWTAFVLTTPQHLPRHIIGEIAFIDSFGNIITNIPGAWLGTEEFVTPIIDIGSRKIKGLVNTYGDARAGKLVALISSEGHLEVAVVNGNAADRLQRQVGDPVVVTSAPQR